ncbi:MAG: glycosyltransferase, partial [Clostridiales bacterium]|nr:glycosyltransferase [Clostridiales bacterium]
MDNGHSLNKPGPKVCVTMPCYNHEKYVGQAIESVLNQTHANLELYIINDGSTDNSKQVIEKYIGDERVHYFEFKKNTHYFGVIRIYDKFIRESGAKYVATLASDDMWALDKLEKQIGLLENSPYYKACFTWDQVLYEDGAGSWMLAEDYSFQGNKSRFEWFYFFFRWGNRINSCSMLMDKEVYLELGGYNPNFRAIGDLYLWMLLATKYPFYLIPEKLTYYRRHGNNLSTVDVHSIQLATEDYILTKNLIVDMGRDYFVKTFTELIIFSDWDNPFALPAEKIMLLFSLGRAEYDQVAMEIYIAGSANEGFAEFMETRYGFTTGWLDYLMRNSGLASVGKQPAHGYEFAASFSRAQILLGDIAAGSLAPEKLHIYPYNFLFDLLQKNNFKGETEAIKGLLYSVQKQQFMQKQKRKVVFVVGGASGWGSDLSGYPWIDAGKDNIYFSLLPERAKVFIDDTEYNYKAPPTAKCLDLFVKGEHYIASCMEMGLYPDLLVFVDCINTGYSWDYLLIKHSMDVLVAYIDSGTVEGGIEYSWPIVHFFDGLN